MNIAKYLGTLLKTREVFIKWYTQHKADQMPIASFLALDFDYQIGIFIDFLYAHNICCSIYANNYDVFVIHNVLLGTLPQDSNLDYIDVDLNILYIAYQKPYPVINTTSEIYLQALAYAFKFLNEHIMDKTPF